MTVQKLIFFGVALFMAGSVLVMLHAYSGDMSPMAKKFAVKAVKIESALPEPPIYPSPDQEVSSECSTSFSKSNPDLDSTTLIYFVTPTYTRREQIAELTRLGQTLMHVPNLHWIVSEDAELCSPLVESLLGRFSSLSYTHIVSPMPRMYNSKAVLYKPRGVSSRRAAINWIVQNRPKGRKSVLYFGDDDNTYDLQIFEEIRKTRKVSLFPVGFIGTQGISSPVVESQSVPDPAGRLVTISKVIGFTDDWFAHRKFPIDMAGFAVDVDLLVAHGGGSMPYKAGYEEDYFLQSLNLTLSDFEPLAQNCTQILVWHTHTEKKAVPALRLQNNDNSNLVQLLADMASKGAATVSQRSGHPLKVCLNLTGCD